MIKNIDDFVKYIPTARGTRFEDIKVFIEEGVSWLKIEIFGKELVEYITSTEDDIARRSLGAIIALKAYSLAIPFLDVVQTTNGFAIVNNTNHAPASRERVDKLMQWVEQRLYTQVDSLIEYISCTPTLLAEWKQFERFDYLTELVFWTGNDLLSYFGNSQQYNRSKSNIPYVELHKMHSTIKGIQDTYIADSISCQYLEELIESKRKNDLVPEAKRIYDRIKHIVGLFILGQDNHAKSMLDEIVNMMMRNLDKYPKFADSEAYKIKVADKYVNLQSDGTYFFGG